MLLRLLGLTAFDGVTPFVTPRLAPWAAFFRRSAARMLALERRSPPYVRRGSTVAKSGFVMAAVLTGTGGSAGWEPFDGRVGGGGEACASSITGASAGATSGRYRRPPNAFMYSVQLPSAPGPELLRVAPSDIIIFAS